MTDRERHETDGRLQETYTRAQADYSRRRQEARELGEYLRAFGQVLIDRPERIALPANGVFEHEQWFLVSRDLPTLHDVTLLALELRALADLVGQSANDLKARGLTR